MELTIIHPGYVEHYDDVKELTGLVDIDNLEELYIIHYSKDITRVYWFTQNDNKNND
jgi:hypothetical protein